MGARIYLTTNEGIDVNESYEDIASQLRDSQEPTLEVTRPNGKKLTLIREHVVYAEPGGS